MKLYYSINISDVIHSKEVISRANRNDYIFISLHFSEEVNKSYINSALELTSLAHSKGLKIIGDISKKTLDIFKVKSLDELYKNLHLYAFRIDYGYSLDEIKKIAKRFPVAVNASTLSKEEIIEIKKDCKYLIAMHNFYPRPETGLDMFQFLNKSYEISMLDIPLFAFISGDIALRGPIFKGLPTLEETREYLPHISFIFLDSLSVLDGVFTSDDISKKERDLISYYINYNVIPIKAISNEDIFNKVFTIRSDSPSNLIRIKESREYASKGKIINPKNTVKRVIGSITIDNKLYKRYSGEIMIVKSSLPKDNKVNVIGKVKKESLPLLKIIKNNQKFILLK